MLPNNVIYTINMQLILIIDTKRCVDIEQHTMPENRAMTNKLPDIIKDVEQLDEILSRPASALVDAMSRIKGDIIVLGAVGKMGPTLTRMAKRASDEAGTKRRVIGVDRDNRCDEQFKTQGIEPIQCDLLDDEQVANLPDAPNIIYMAGMKFGATGNESLTWAMNTYLPSVVSKRYKNSRIVAFSTGNTYGLVPVSGPGSVETDDLNPFGEYAMSCMGRERIFEHFSKTLNIPITIIRLNYACEMRYGVLVDLAQQIHKGKTIDLAMGYANVIWQADANDMVIRSLEHTDSPPFILNVAGDEVFSAKDVCEKMAKQMSKKVTFTGEPSPDALINNGSKGHKLFSKPAVGVDKLTTWIADWVANEKESLGKATHFEVRDGKF